MMCGGSLARRTPRLQSVEACGENRGRGVWVLPVGPTGFFELDVEEMGPWARAVTGLAVLVPVVLSGLLLVAFAPGLWWVFTTYGWVSFPAFALLVRGAAGLSEGRGRSRPAESRERELLRALRSEASSRPPGRPWRPRSPWPRPTRCCASSPRAGIWRCGCGVGHSSMPCGEGPGRSRRETREPAVPARSGGLAHAGGRLLRGERPLAADG
jgi:hypothetical protein